MSTTKDVVVSDMGEYNFATVHGVFVGAVSPVKSSRKKSDIKYFEANLSDGEKTVRVVSFEPRLRAQVEETNKTRRRVAVSNCCVKRSRGDALEILANNKSSIVSSPKKFKINYEEIEEKYKGVTSGCHELGTIEELKDLQEHQHINVVGKVQSILPVEEIKGKCSKKLVKQDFVLADCTGVCRGVTWEQQVNVLKEEESYRFFNATVRSFNGAEYISLGEKSEVEKIKDIGDVVDKSVFDGSGELKVFKAEIVAVISVEMYSSCRNCNAKVLEGSGGIAMCSKCNSKMKLAKCGKKGIACVILKDEDNNERKVTIFSEILDQLIGFVKLQSGSIDLVRSCYQFRSYVTPLRPRKQ